MNDNSFHYLKNQAYLPGENEKDITEPKEQLERQDLSENKTERIYPQRKINKQNTWKIIQILIIQTQKTLLKIVAVEWEIFLKHMK